MSSQVPLPTPVRVSLATLTPLPRELSVIVSRSLLGVSTNLFQRGSPSMTTRDTTEHPSSMQKVKILVTPLLQKQFMLSATYKVFFAGCLLECHVGLGRWLSVSEARTFHCLQKHSTNSTTRNKKQINQLRGWVSKTETPFRSLCRWNTPHLSVARNVIEWQDTWARMHPQEWSTPSTYWTTNNKCLKSGETRLSGIRVCMPRSKTTY